MTGKANCFEKSGAPDSFYTVKKKINNWKLRHLHVVGDNRGRSSSVGERLTAEREVGGSISGAGLIPIMPLLSSKNPHFQNEARCTTFLVKMSFICMRMKNDFHIKGWALTLVLKERPGGTRKWPIQPRPQGPLAFQYGGRRNHIGKREDPGDESVAY